MGCGRDGRGRGDRDRREWDGGRRGPVGGGDVVDGGRWTGADILDPDPES